MTDLKKSIKEMYQAGKSLREIGEEIGKSTQTVLNLMRRFGIKRRPPSNRDIWDNRREEIEYLYHKAEFTQKQIAQYFGVTQNVIHRVMKRLAIARRSPKDVWGPKHPNFKHGKNSVRYRSMITKDKCRKCGATETLGIHHKNDDHYDNRLENLEILCNSCHMSETKKKWWAAKKSGKKTPKSNAPTGWRKHHGKKKRSQT